MSKWAFFTMPTHQMWSYHMTQEENFEKFLFYPNSSFNIRKSHKIASGKALHARSYQPETVENTPVLLGLNDLFFILIVFITAENMSCIHIKQ